MLTDIEKHAIANMVNTGMTPEEIRGNFDSDKRQYINTEIKKASKKKGVEKNSAAFDKAAVLTKLAKAGIHGQDAENLISKALPHVSSKPEVNELYNAAISMIGAKELMIRETEGGKKTVAVMTPQASAKGEKIERSKSRQQESYVFNPNREV